MNDAVPVLALKNVSKEYPSAPEPVSVLRDVNLELGPGERLTVIGPSGSGKSTLLNLMGTLDTPSSGTLEFKGRDLAVLSPAERARLRNREIGFVFQWHHLLPQCTVLENVLVPTLVGGGPPGARERAMRLLDRVGLGARLHHRPGQISGGESQRAAVVRALINRPSLLLADEPTGSLNPEAAEHLAGLLLELNREEGMALVVVTHAPSIAARLGNLREMRDGRPALRD